MYCSQCGHELGGEGNFCKHCGAHLQQSTNHSDIKQYNQNAGFIIRFAAFIVDLAIIYFLLFIIFIIFGYFGLYTDIDPTVDKAITIVFLVLYHTFFLYKTSATPGKSLFGLKVVQGGSNQPITLTQSFGRSCAYLLSSLFFGIGFIRIATNKDKMGFHDSLARTNVLRNSKQNMLLPSIIFMISILFVIYVQWLATYDNSTVEETPTPTPLAQETAAGNDDQLTEVEQADYDEGYKAGYVDGRSSQGQFGDSYSPPATEERRAAYTVGYLDGMVKGCREGSFDCSSIEELVKQLYEENGGTNSEQFDANNI